VLQRQGTKQGFRGALAFYPGCGPKALLAQTLTTSAPITMLLGADDEEVSPQRCQEVAQRSIAAGSKIDLKLYPGATHGFDDPGRKHQSVPGNAAATADILKRAIAIVDTMKD
jgi:carboxymethylenebutenolidase